MSALERRRRVLDRAARRAGEAVALEVQRTVERFAGELDRYGELIVGPGQAPFGFMVRGEGPDFTARAARVLAEWGMNADARSHHLRLARSFEHKRAFLKLEWHPEGDRLAAFYYRRRPHVDDAVSLLARAGALPAALDAALDMAAALDKRTVHFVSAAVRPRRPLHHKLYFSQWVTDETRAAVAARLEAVAGQAGVGDAWSRWRPVHDALLARHADTTLFASLNLTAERRLPGFKIDYPDADPLIAAEGLPTEAQRPALDEMRALARLLDRRVLSYLGVRFAKGPAPAFKYYLDFPERRI